MWSRPKPMMAPAPYRALLPSRLFRAGFANAALSRHSWVVSGSLAIIGCWINRRAFSSEVGTGSREENASNKEVEPPFRFHRNGKGSSEPNPRPLAQRLLWFAALWLGGVGTVSIVAFGLRLWIA